MNFTDFVTGGFSTNKHILYIVDSALGTTRGSHGIWDGLNIEVLGGGRDDSINIYIGNRNKPHLYFQKSSREYKTVLDRINKKVVPALKKEWLGVTIEQNAGHIAIKG